jgi:hypothetical protein
VVNTLQLLRPFMILARMASDYLQYTPWASLTTDGRPPSPLDFYAASAQFDHIRLAVGDTVWQVSLRPLRADGQLPGALLLCARLLVHYVTDDEREARRRIGHYPRCEDYPPRTESQHAFAREGGEELYAAIAIDDLAPELRFLSKHDRLTLADGHADPQQLQAMRRLAPGSAALLAARWEAHRNRRMGL